MITFQIVNSSAISDVIIDKGADIVVGVIIAIIVGVGGYYLGTRNEKRKQKIQSKTDIENEKKEFDKLYPQLKKEIESNYDKAKDLRDFFSMRQYKFAADPFTWTESSKKARSFSYKGFKRLNEAKLQKYVKPDFMNQIEDFYDKLSEWTKSIEVSRDACLSTRTCNAENLVYLELINAGEILRNFDPLIKAISDEK